METTGSSRRKDVQYRVVRVSVSKEVTKIREPKIENIPGSQKKKNEESIANRDSKGLKGASAWTQRNQWDHHGVTQEKRGIGGSQKAGMVQKRETCAVFSLDYDTLKIIFICMCLFVFICV